MVYITAAVAPALAGKPFFSTSRSTEIVEADVHILAGATYVTQNYASEIAGVDKADSHPGLGLGFGSKVSFPFRDYLALSTGLDLLWGHNTCDMTVIGDGTGNVNHVYLSNRYLYTRVPVLLSLRFNMADNARWVIDMGFYGSIGVAGKQKADIYTTGVNQLGQLVTTHYKNSWNYFRSDTGFIHGVHSFDFGLQLGSSICFRDHYVAGVTFTYGLKDAACAFGPLRGVSMHNIDWLCHIGYKF